MNPWKKRFILLATMLVIIFAIMVVVIDISKVDDVITPDTPEYSALPKVENFENFKKLTKANDNTRFNTSVMDTMESAIAPQATGKGEATNQAADYSTTNVQVQGVDEADIIKTDGKYIYYLSTSKLVVVEASNLKIVKEIKYYDKNNNKENFYPTELYVNNNKLVVIGTYNVYEQAENQSTSNEDVINTKIAPSLYYMPRKTTTKAICYDINNGNISEKRTVEIEGSYLSSRMIGDDVYLVSNKYIYGYNILREDIKQEEVQPTYKDTAVSGDYVKIGFDSMCYFPDTEADSYMLVAGFNVNNKEEANVETYLGSGSTIYASQSNLYVINTKYKYNENVIDNVRGVLGIGSVQYEVNTEIYKFSLNNGKTLYQKNAVVPGTVLNQFSMDEYNGNFRIATTKDSGFSGETSVNNMYILNKDMEQIGKIEDLAKGERIYSVRFMGDKGYMVTFRQVDPLFVIDLSDAQNPKVLGELKIPGFSDYLHPYDENHIIGFGQDTEVIKDYYGERVVTTGMKMSLFDVSNPTNPKELFTTKIGDKGTYSELLNNHKALLFSKEKNIIAFPISINKNKSESSISYGQLEFQGAIIYNLDLNFGFTEKARISHIDLNKTNKDYYYDYNAQVDRIIYIGDTLYTASKGLIKAIDLNNMKEKGSVKIEIEEQSGGMEILPMIDIME